MDDEFNGGLKEVAIEGEDNNQLVADLSICAFYDSYFLLPITLFILSLLFSIAFPSLYHTMIDNYEIEKDLKINKITSSLINLSPKNQFLEIFLKFPNIDLLKINNFNLSFKLQTDSRKFEQSISKLENLKDPNIVPLFFTTNIDFSYATLELTIQSLPPTPVSIIWETQDLITVKYILSIRVCWALCVILYFYNLIMKLKSQGMNSLTTTQLLTIPLMLLFTLYIFPFNFLFPSHEAKIFEIIVKNLYFAYVLFYSMTIYTYIVERPEDSSYQYYLLPYFILIVCSVSWIIKDIQNVYPQTDFIFPTSIYQIQPPLYYSVHMSVFFVILIIWMFGFSRKLQPLHESRFRYYLIVNLCSMLYFIAYMVLVHFDNIVSRTASASILPLIGFSLYTLLMANGQYDIEEMQYALTNPMIEIQDNQIGIDPA